MLNAHSKTAIESLYLETGTIPLRFLVKSRRINYLHHILTRNNDELIQKVYKDQCRKPIKDDWAIQVKDDLESVEISLSDEKIKWFRKAKFKKLVRSKIQENALKYLNDLKMSHKKVKTLIYKKAYLKDSNLSIEKKQLMFRLRTRMLDIKDNFSFLYLDKECTLGCKDVESQEQLLNCDTIIKNCVELSEDLEVEYEDIVGDITQQTKFINLYKYVMDTRKELMKTLSN